MSFMLHWFLQAEKATDQRQWCMYAWFKAGDQGAGFGGVYAWSALKRIFVSSWSIISSSSRCWSSKFGIWKSCWRNFTMCAWLHCKTMLVQNLVTFCSWQLCTLCLDMGAGVVLWPPKRISGSKSKPTIWWSPLIRLGLPNKWIHGAATSAFIARGFPAIRLIAWLPHWWIAGFQSEGYQWWCRLAKLVLVKIWDIWDLGSSMGSLASRHMMIAFLAWCHIWICLIRSVTKILCSIGLVWPCCWRRHIYCAVVVLDATSNFWLQMQ